MTIDTDIAPTRIRTNRFCSVMWRLVPLGVLGIVGWINGIGAWPTFRQQDTSLLHWILVSNSEALKGLSQAIKSEGPVASNDLSKHFSSYLTLENMNLSGLDLSSSDLSDMSLENVSLAGARLVNADFSCTDLTGVDFSGAKLMNSKFDYSYSRCSDHVSTTGASSKTPYLTPAKSKKSISQDFPKSFQCSSNTRQIVNEQFNNREWPFRPPKPKQPFSYTCLQATFVGADFSKAQIRGDGGRRTLGKDNECDRLLILVGNMSGAVFNEANLTCVALIHQADSPAPVFLAFPNLVQLQNWYAQFTYPGKNHGVPLKNEQANSTEQQPSTKSPKPFSFNGISFTGARLDRVSLLKGPFRFSQFERAKLMGLFLNIGIDKADLDYSRFNEIKCDAPRLAETDNSKGKPKSKTKYWPCLLVQPGASFRPPLHLNLLWSTLVTNLEPIENDSFLCTPTQDLPARVEEKRVESAGFWLTPGMGPEKFPPKPLECPAANYSEPNIPIYHKSNRKWHHVLSSSQSDSKSPSKAVQ